MTDDPLATLAKTILERDEAVRLLRVRDDRIAELEAVLRELNACPVCWAALGSTQFCPSCEQEIKDRQR